MFRQLARGKSRQALHELDGARAAHRGYLAAAPADEFRGELIAGLVPVLRLDDRFHLFPEFRIRHTDDRRIEHLRVRDERVLNRLRIDVDAPRDDHEILAVGQKQVTVLIDAADIAQGVPVGLRRVTRLRHGLRIIQISRSEGRRRFEVDQPFPTARQFFSGIVADMDGTCARSSHGTGFAQPLLGRNIGTAEGLAAAVVLVDDRAQPIDHSPFDLDGTGRCRVQHLLERG